MNGAGRWSPASVRMTTASEGETTAAGEDLGRTLRPGDVVLLFGSAGAGKTTFVRGLARGIGANAEDVSSPTFTIVHEYAGTEVPLFHLDLRHLDAEEIDELGLDDLLAGDGIVAIESPDHWRGRPDDAIQVRMEETGDEARQITVSNAPASATSDQRLRLRVIPPDSSALPS
jgi:tRNA threonylcarbamoyladenosine biosynthesis protein TsaE